ncbi:MAG: hypothetical protein IT256_03750 [Chitinophagaceae bacterium]|nr:hypothetical protein [Chitinophagaceae bacterium]
MTTFTEAYIYSDQPTTCPLCGTRSQVILNLSHTKDKTEVHKCLQSNCGYEFVMQHDQDFEPVRLLNKT